MQRRPIFAFARADDASRLDRALWVIVAESGCNRGEALQRLRYIAEQTTLGLERVVRVVLDDAN